ncbi:hypothetical protein BGC_29650 [Burkholderia sp. 3C]
MWEEKRASLDRDWIEWGRLHVGVVHASCFLPATHSIDEWIADEPKLPINLNRAVSMGWFFASSSEQWLTHLLSLVVERFAETIEANIQELEVAIVLDAAMVVALEAAQFDCQSTLGGLLRKRGIDLTVLVVRIHREAGVEMIDGWIDRPSAIPVLLIAGQRAADPASFSEAGVAILLAMPAEKRLTPTEVLIRRPLLTDAHALGNDFAELMRVQGNPSANLDIWHAGLDQEMQGTILKAASVARNGRAVSRVQFQEHMIDSALGTSGPQSIWIALALALQAASRRQQPQLVASTHGASSIALVMATSEIED